MTGKPSKLKPAERLLLRRVLNGEAGKCRLSKLEGLIRRGWLGATHQLTAEGRRVAELSEQSGMDISLPLEV